MRLLTFALIVTAAAPVSLPAAAQTAVTDAYGGLHWSIAAPDRANWSLECRFAPVTIRNRWLNRMVLTGAGPQRGRLPGQDGRCTLTKTGGAGPVGLAVVKDGQPTAAGTNDPAKPAYINVF